MIDVYLFFLKEDTCAVSVRNNVRIRTAVIILTVCYISEYQLFKNVKKAVGTVTIYGLLRQMLS